MFGAHSILKRDLIATVPALLAGDHPTLDNLRAQLKHDVIGWDLRTNRSPYRVRGVVLEQPPKGTAVLVATLRSSRALPTSPTLELPRGKLSHPGDARTVSSSLGVSDGVLSRVLFRTSDDSEFPHRVKHWRYVAPSDDSDLPVFEEPDCTALRGTFERWLVNAAPRRPNGQPDFCLSSAQYPEAFGRFRRVFNQVDLGPVSFHSQSQCYELEHDGRTFWVFASDHGGDPFCFSGGADVVYHLSHDSTQVEPLGPFETWVRQFFRAQEPSRGHTTP